MFRKLRKRKLDKMMKKYWNNEKISELFTIVNWTEFDKYNVFCKKYNLNKNKLETLKLFNNLCR